MRLHRLTLTAFEPFAATETVDFDALGEAGLFLMQGETGAGKTAILDGICFALFGRVPGARDSAPRLRSDHSRGSGSHRGDAGADDRRAGGCGSSARPSRSGRRCAARG